MVERSRDNRFDAAWLKVREVADARSRNRAIIESLRAHFSIRADMGIVDLGCGIGGNLRALYPYLPNLQRWTLVESDRDLLDAARTSLTEWADRAKQKSRRDDVLVLEKGQFRLEVIFRAAQLDKHLDQLLDGWPDLVVASALLDLVSRPLAETLVDKISTRQIPLYASHTADGALEWYPDNRTDALIFQAIGKSATRDRGFGPPIGPRAANIVTDLLRARGAIVETGTSAWQLTGSADRELMIWLADGVASAAADTKLVPETIAATWAQSRAMAESVIIGHHDIFATF